MEFVGDKKIACFCGAPKCSGLIGEKVKEIKEEKKTAVKRKWKIKPLVAKVTKPEPETESDVEPQPAPKRRKKMEDTSDPIEVLMDRVPQKGATSYPKVEITEEEPSTSNEPARVHHVTGEDELEELSSAVEEMPNTVEMANNVEEMPNTVEELASEVV